jgi:hypothetical protein
MATFLNTNMRNEPSQPVPSRYYSRLREHLPIDETLLLPTFRINEHFTESELSFPPPYRIETGHNSSSIETADQEGSSILGGEQKDVNADAIPKNLRFWILIFSLMLSEFLVCLLHFPKFLSELC